MKYRILREVKGRGICKTILPQEYQNFDVAANTCDELNKGNHVYMHIPVPIEFTLSSYYAKSNPQ